MQNFEGHFNAAGHRYAIVAARFNMPITELLLKGAIECLKRHGAHEDNMSVAWVPGAFEIPLIAKKMAESGKFDAVVCVGAVIKGETPHFDFVAGQAASGMLQVSLSTNVPVIFSVVTTNTKEQAEVRAGSTGANVGFNGALAAIEMVNLIKMIS